MHMYIVFPLLLSVLTACGGGGGAELDKGGDNPSAESSSGSELLDSDRDGVLDPDDAFPYDSSEFVDTDGDSTGNNADKDDDGDGYPDILDQFPLDSEESLDSDGDSIGNNADEDDDGDTHADGSDAFPLDSREWLDSDGDGIGNNEDTDDDNDGYSDTLEISDGSDPLLVEDTPIDTDSDFIPNSIDIDDDNDGLIEIYTLVQLDWMRNSLNGESLINNSGTVFDEGCVNQQPCAGYELMSDIDFDDDGINGFSPTDSFYNGGEGWLPIGTTEDPFTATFYGNGFKLMSFVIDRPDEQYTGLFGVINGNAVDTAIENVVLQRLRVKGGKYTGGLVAYATNINSIEMIGASSLNVESASNITEGGVGGIIGYAENVSNISNNQITVVLKGHTNGVGGILGRGSNIGAISQNVASVYVYNPAKFTGGIAGRLTLVDTVSANVVGGSVYGTYVDSHVPPSSGTFVGGIVGWITITTNLVDNKFNGNLESIDRVGGIAGQASGVDNVSSNHAAIAMKVGKYGQNGMGSLAGGILGNVGSVKSIVTNSAVGSINNPGTMTGGLLGSADSVDLIQNNRTSVTITPDDYSNVGHREVSRFCGGLVGYFEPYGTNIAIKNNLILGPVECNSFKGAVVGSLNGTTFTSNYFQDRGVNATGDVRAPKPTGTAGYYHSTLRCPVTSSDKTCAAGTLYDGWDELVWDFGTSSDLPTLID